VFSMTEAEWNISTDAGRMLSFVAGSASAVVSVGGRFLSERRLRLFLVGCCRRWWPVFTAERLTTAIETMERYADGEASDSDRDQARQLAQNAVYYASESLSEATYHRTDFSEAECAFEAAQAARIVCLPGDQWRTLPLHDPDGVRSAYGLAQIARVAAGWTARTRGGAASDRQAVIDAEQAAQANLLRCVAGNPFHAVRAEPDWRTAPVVGIAEAIYAERAFDRLPILADALEDAGCADADVLTHCRAHPEHARGCWVVDMVLGKG
jgi:hypothetical protein